MTEKVQVSVGIITRDRARYLDDCLESILGQTKLPDQVIVYNDGSTDQTESVVRSKEKKFHDSSIEFKYLFSHECKAQPYGRNKIIENSAATIIAFVDDDVVCVKSWLKNLSTSYWDVSVGGVGGPAIRVDYNMKPVWREIKTDRNINIINKYGEVCDYSDNWIPPLPVETHVLRGANMSFRRDVLIEIGGFDENYFGRAYMEDTDVQVRIQDAGYRLIYNPQVYVFHRAIPVGGANVRSKKSDWHSVGFTSAYFIRKYFWQYYLITISRMFFRVRYSPIPIPRLFFEAIRQRSVAPLWAMKGYFDGFRKWPHSRLKSNS